MAALVELRLVTTDAWSRRKVHQLGGAAAAASIAIIALPSVAAAASGSGDGGGGTTSTLPNGGQLLVNPSFDDGTTGWSAPAGFGSSSLPTVSSGQLRLTYGFGPLGSESNTRNNVSQKVTIPSISSATQLVAATQVAGWDGGFGVVGSSAFEVTFYDSADSVLTMLHTPASGQLPVPTTPTPVSLAVRTEARPSALVVHGNDHQHPTSYPVANDKGKAGRDHDPLQNLTAGVTHDRRRSVGPT